MDRPSTQVTPENVDLFWYLMYERYYKRKKKKKILQKTNKQTNKFGPEKKFEGPQFVNTHAKMALWNFLVILKPG